MDESKFRENERGTQMNALPELFYGAAGADLHKVVHVLFLVLLLVDGGVTARASGDRI